MAFHLHLWNQPNLHPFSSRSIHLPTTCWRLVRTPRMTTQQGFSGLSMPEAVEKHSVSVKLLLEHNGTYAMDKVMLKVPPSGIFWKVSTSLFPLWKAWFDLHSSCNCDLLCQFSAITLDYCHFHQGAGTWPVLFYALVFVRQWHQHTKSWSYPAM